MFGSSDSHSVFLAAMLALGLHQQSESHLLQVMETHIQTNAGQQRG